MNKRFLLIFTLVFFQAGYMLQNNLIFAQEEEEFELYLIDNYLRSNEPSKLVISWMTNVEAKSKVNIPSLGTFTASDTLTDKIFLVIDVSKLLDTPGDYDFSILSELEDGTEIQSEKFIFTVPNQEIQPLDTKRSEFSYYFYTCCVGGSLWLVPSLGLSMNDKTSKFTISKEMPLLSFGSSSAFKNYPYSYVFTGYTHTLKGDAQNIFRYGYRQLFELKKIINYLSIGLSGFTNFKGANGISPEVSFSFLRILSTFDLYFLYRFDKELKNGNYSSHQIQLGLYTSSFSLNVNF